MIFEQLWESVWFRGLIYLLAGLALLAVAYAGRTALFPFLIAFFLAYLVNPVIDFMVGRDKEGKPKRSRTFSVVAFFILLLLLTVLSFIIVIPLFAGQVSSFFRMLPEYVSDLSTQLEQPLQNWFGITIPESLDQALEELRKSQIVKSIASGKTSMITSGIAWTFGSIINLITVVVNVVLVPILLFYILLQYHNIVGFIDDLLPRQYRHTIRHYVQETDRVLGSFIKGQLLVAMILVVMFSVALLIAGVPQWLLIGVFAGAVSVVPYLGGILGIAPALALSYAEHGDPIQLLYVLVAFWVVQMIEGNIITPKVMSDSVGLHPLAVIFALLFGASLLGFLGVLIAVPAAAVIAVFLQDGLQKYYESGFYKGSRNGDAKEANER